MLKIDRSTRITGPAAVFYKGVVFTLQDGSVFDPGIATTDIKSDLGTVDDFRSGQVGKITGTLVGEVTQDQIDVLFDALDQPTGASLLDGTESPLSLKPYDLAQDMIVFPSAIISKMPGLKLTVKATVFGDIEFTILRKNNYNVAADDSLYSVETNDLDLGALPFDPANILIQPYFASLVGAGRWKATFGADTSAYIAYNATATALQTAINAGAAMTTAGGVAITGNFVVGYLVTANVAGTFGAITGAIFADAGGGVMPPNSSIRVEVITAGATSVHAVYLITLAPWSGFGSETGFDVTPAQTNTNVPSEISDPADITLNDIKATVAFTPQGISMADWLAIGATQGAKSLLGTKGSTIGNTLTLAGANGGLTVTLNKAKVTKQPIQFKLGTNRIGQMELTASRSLGAGGTLLPVIDITTDDVP